MMVSVVTFPRSLTKKSCSTTEVETVRSEGSLRRSFPNLVGWLGNNVLHLLVVSKCMILFCILIMLELMNVRFKLQ